MMICCELRAVTGFAFFFFFNYTATTEIFSLSLHDALPIFSIMQERAAWVRAAKISVCPGKLCPARDRKSTRLNSSHQATSYAVFCLKNKRGGKSTGFGLIYDSVQNAKKYKPKYRLICYFLFFF